MKGNRGITMIELVIGMAIFSVVGLMAGSLLSSSVRMYRKTVSYSDLQTESQSVSRRISAVVMNASELYIDDTQEGFYLFTGSITGGAGRSVYAGEIIWYNKATGCMYQNDLVSIEAVDQSAGTPGTDTTVPLNADLVRAALEGGADSREYLISDKIKKLEVSLSPQPVRKPDSLFSVTDQNVTLYYTITLGIGDGEEYVVSTGATPRNRIGRLHYEKTAGAGN